MENTNPNHIKELIEKLKIAGCSIEIEQDKLYIIAPNRLKATNIITKPYPGFPTDLQSIFAATMVRSVGNSNIVENIFENRFKYVPELRKMGANIKEKTNEIIVTGTEEIYGNKIKATDLRGGAALIIASLQAKGESKISNIQYILRGYDNVDIKLKKLGAEIKTEEGE